MKSKQLTSIRAQICMFDRTLSAWTLRGNRESDRQLAEPDGKVRQGEVVLGAVSLVYEAGIKLASSSRCARVCSSRCRKTKLTCARRVLNSAVALSGTAMSHCMKPCARQETEIWQSPGSWWNFHISPGKGSIRGQSNRKPPVCPIHFRRAASSSSRGAQERSRLCGGLGFRV